MSYEISFLKSLLTTIAFETAVLYIIAKRNYFNLNIKTAIAIFAGILASCTTLPYLWFIFPVFIKNKLAYIILSELTAVFAESLILKVIFKTSYSKALLISFLMNTISYSVGFILRIY